MQAEPRTHAATFHTDAPGICDRCPLRPLYCPRCSADMPANKEATDADRT